MITDYGLRITDGQRGRQQLRARRHSIRHSSFVIRHSPRHRRGFTIAELVVSVGVLSILLLMAGSIFTLTLKSSGDATALIDVHQLFRALEDNLREDLANVSRTNSLMVIQGNPINAYWTADEAEVDTDGNPYTGLMAKRDPQREIVDMSSGSPVQRMERPRADILMFFTAREGTSRLNPGISGRLQQVVYGHADLGELNASTGQWTPTTLLPALGPSYRHGLKVTSFSPPASYDPADPSLAPDIPTLIQLPARQWHLARRSVLIVDEDVSAFDAPVDLNDAVAAGNDPMFVGLPRTNYIRDDRRDFIQNATASGFDYETSIVLRVPDPAYDNTPANVDAAINWMARSQLDLGPPATQGMRMGDYFVPNCASFKVEWALEVANPSVVGEIVWVDPGDFAGTIQRIYSRVDRGCAESPPNDELSNTMVGQYCSGLPAPVRVAEPALFKLLPYDLVKNPNTDPEARPTRFVDFDYPATSTGSPYPTHVFYSAKPDIPGSAYQPDPLFPKALRITVDVYDPAGRLDRPIRHVMVLPVGRD